MPDLTKVYEISPSTFGKNFMRDPYPVYEDIRAHGGMAKYVVGSYVTWVISEYDDILFLLRNRQLLSNKNLMLLESFYPRKYSELGDFFGLIKQWIIFMDGSKQALYHKLMIKGMAQFLARDHSETISRMVDKVLHGLRDKREADLVTEFAQKIPALVMNHIMGIPEDMAPKFIEQTNDIIKFYGSIMAPALDAQRAREAIVGLTDYFGRHIEENRANPSDNFIGFLLGQEEVARNLTAMDLQSLCVSLLFGGYETTTHLIGTGALCFQRFPEQRRKVLESPGLIDSAIEEILRFDSPAQMLGRVAGENMELKGMEIQKGDRVLLLLGAANNDPARFEDPREFNVERKFTSYPLTFGAGPHTCPGASLTKSEARIAFMSLLREFPGYKPKSDKPDWKTLNPGFRGLGSLWVDL
jgi:cytochrome P450